MTTATRGNVHRSVPNPLARAPCLKAASTLRNWAASNFGFRPARPALRSAATPPFFHCWYQRLTLCRLDCSIRATEASLSPAWNNFAACLRRFSKA